MVLVALILALYFPLISAEPHGLHGRDIDDFFGSSPSLDASTAVGGGPDGPTVVLEAVGPSSTGTEAGQVMRLGDLLSGSASQGESAGAPSVITLPLGDEASIGGTADVPLGMFMDGPTGLKSMGDESDPLSVLSGDPGASMTISFGPETLPDGSVVSSASPSDIMNVDDFRSIFGGQTGSGGHVGAASPDSAQGMVDPFMKDIFAAMDATIAQELLPLGHHHHELPCEEDEKKLCPKPTSPDARASSALQCLGKHADQVSDKCKKDVKMSLPFNCADEIQDGCDGVDEAIITCLSKRAEVPRPPLRVPAASWKPLRESCKSSLDVTRSLIHKVNTMASTVVSTAPWNQTHVSKTKTTRVKDNQSSVNWKCPEGFKRGTASTAVSQPCCAGHPGLTSPRTLCVDAGGRWNLVADQGSFNGMQCCPPESAIVSRIRTQPVPKKNVAQPAPPASQTPWGTPPEQSEASGRSLIAICAVSILFGMAIRTASPTAVIKSARKLGIPSHYLKMAPANVQAAMYSVDSKQDLDELVNRKEYGTL